MTVEIRRYLVEMEHSNGYYEIKNFNDVIDHFMGRGVEFVFNERDRLGDVYVTVPVWEEGRRRYAQEEVDSFIKLDYFG